MTTNRRGPYGKSALTKRVILDACAGALAEQGFAGLTMAEVARRAGISHTGLLHHFPDRESLLRALLQMADARAEADLPARAAGVPTDPGDLIGALISLADTDAGEDRWALSTRLSAEAGAPTHPAHEQVADRYERVRGFLASHLSALAAQGRLVGELTPDQLAAMAVALVEGLRLQRRFATLSIDLGDAVTSLLAPHVPELGARGHA